MPWKILVNHINVNAGDSTLIRVYEGTTLQKTVLVDAGTQTAGLQRVRPFLIAQGVKQIDAIVITHYDADHVGGFNKLFGDPVFLNLLENTRVYDTGIYMNAKNGNQPSTPYTDYVKHIDQLVESGKITHVTSFGAETVGMGTEILWDSKLLNIPKGNLAQLRSKNPAANDKPALFCIASNKSFIQPMGVWPDGTSDINQRCIALALVSENNDILYYAAGDLGETYEDQLLPWLKANLGEATLPVMKVSHHGGQYSTPYDFINKLQPSNAIISCGRQYWHPSLAVLAAFADNNMQTTSNTTIFSTNYPYYLADAPTFSRYITESFNSCVDSLLKQLKTAVLIEDIQALSNDQQLVHGKGIWASCDGHPSNASDGVRTYIATDSKQPSRGLTNIEVTLESSGVGQPYTTSVTETLFKSLKRKRPAFISTLAMGEEKSTSATTYTIGANGVTGVNINLVKGCALDHFVSQLTPPQLVLSGNPVGHSCMVVNTSALGKWFAQCSFSMSITITASALQDGYLNVNCVDVTFEAQLDATQLGIGVSLAGSLNQNGVLSFDNLSASSTAIAISPLHSAQFLGFVGQDGKLFDFLSPLASNVLQQTPNMLTFAPPSETALSQTQIQLTSQISEMHLGTLSLKKVMLTFSQTLHPTLDHSLTGECTGGMKADLAVNGSSPLSVSVMLSASGAGEITVTPSIDIVEDLIQAALPNSTTAYSSLLTNFGQSITLQSLSLRFDLAELTIHAIKLLSQIRFCGLTLDIDATFPDNMIFGSIADQGTAQDLTINPSSFQSFATSAGFGVPSHFPAFNLVNFCFSAQCVTGDYACSADLKLDNGNNTWALSSQISLENIAFSFNKSASTLNTSLSAFLHIGTQWAIVTGVYTTDAGWQFSATISQVKLSDILSCVGCNSKIMPVSDVSLTNISLNIDINSKTFSLKAVTILGEIVLVIGDDAKLFSLALPNYNNPDLPVVGKIPTITDSLQLAYATKSMQQGDSMITLFQQIASTSLPTPKEGLTEGLQLLIDFNSSLGFSESTYSLNIWSPTPTLVTTYTMPMSGQSQTSPPPSGLSIAVNRSLGPLILNRLGLNFHDDKLWFLFDADIMLGELKIQLDDLEVGITLDAIDIPKTSLAGLGLDYQSGAVQISGDFLHSGNTYQGFATLGMEDLTVAGMGAYSLTQSNHPSVFVFARMNEPLGGPPFFYVMGFSGGFGYNWKLRLPTQAEVVNFPLVTGSIDPSPVSPLSDMSAMMDNLTSGSNPWLSPKDGDQWLAVGVDFTTFELINTRALIVAEFGKDSQFALLGRSYMQLPKVTTHPVAYAEMGMEASYNPDKGSLCMTALLSPNSYVLTPDCHLTGGFAFYSWFKGEHEGDFVVSLGGYHPSFKRPAWYPSLPRLGFNWQVSDQVTIGGESYFALTPSSVMLGGMLKASLHAGDLRAWFRACSDFLVAWHPFNYGVDIGISVGASYRLHLLFCTKTISAEIGANLRLAGPPTHGNVHVNWYIISFGIPFGQQVTDTPTLDWTAFRELLPKSTASTKSAIAKQEGQNTTSLVSLNRIILGSGLLAQSTNDATWIVRADTFTFYTLAAIPATSITFNGDEVSDDAGQASPADAIYVKPMGIDKGIEHTHAVTINAPGQWSHTINTTNVPDALWGLPGPLTLETTLLPNRWTGITVSAPPATQGASPGNIATDAFEDVSVHSAPLPFNQTSSRPTPVADVNGSRTTIAQTIYSTNSARGDTVNTLNLLGLFKIQPLDSMDIMAQKVRDGEYLSEPPLQTPFNT